MLVANKLCSSALVDLPMLLTSAERVCRMWIGSSKILVLSRKPSSSTLPKSVLKQIKEV